MELVDAGATAMSDVSSVVDFPEETGSGPINGHSFGLQRFLHALQAMRTGDFSVRLPTEYTGLEGKVCDTFNEIVAANERMAEELEHVGQVVGREGKTRTRVRLGLSGGAWGRWKPLSMA